MGTPGVRIIEVYRSNLVMGCMLPVKYVLLVSFLILFEVSKGDDGQKLALYILYTHWCQVSFSIIITG